MTVEAVWYFCKRFIVLLPFAISSLTYCGLVSLAVRLAHYF